MKTDLNANANLKIKINLKEKCCGNGDISREVASQFCRRKVDVNRSFSYTNRNH